MADERGGPSTSAEDDLEITLRSIADAVIATDARGRVTRMNPVAETLTGWPLADARGRPLAEVFRIFNEHTRAPVESPVDKVLREGTVVGLANHTVLVARGGGEVPVADSGAPIKGPDGAVRGVVLVFRDQSAERAAEARAARLTRALRALGECNRAVLRATDEARLLAELCRIIVESCGYRMAWVGFAEQDAERRVRPVAQAGFEEGYLESIRVSWADDEHGRGPTGRAVRTGQPVAARNLLTEPDYEPWREQAAKRGYASSLALPLRVRGAVVGALMIYAAEPNAFDDGELALLEDLADDVAFGVAALRAEQDRQRMQTELVFAERMASVGTLAAGVAHEVNNPLAYVIANLEFARRELTLPAGTGARPVDSARLVEALDESLQGATRIRDIVRSLKSFSRVEGGGAADVDVNKALEAALRLTANEIRHRARLTRALGEVPSVRGEETRLIQVFVNLLANAAQALPEDDFERHRIAVRTFTAGEGAVAIEIADTGHGIAPEILPRIFQPFFTTKPAGVGTGLGLSISRDIVQSMGGEISVVSEPGAGTTLRVTLPAAAKSAAADHPAAATAPAAAPLLRVLFLDDERNLGIALSRALEGVFAVTAVDEAEAALRLLREGERFDAIVCDLMMPNVDGAAFFERLAGIDPALQRRVIFSTGGIFTQRAREFVARISNPVMEKPFDMERFAALVRQAAGRPG